MKVGITGHQDVGALEVEQWVDQQIRRFVSNHPVDLGFTCLARGADQIFARVLLDNEIPYFAIIPSDDYNQTFPTAAARDRYEYFLSHAADVRRIGYSHASQVSFFEASKDLVDSSDRILAVWDGHPAKGLGGTADVVAYALKQHKCVLHIDVRARRTLEL